MDWEIDFIEKFSSHLGDFLLKTEGKKWENWGKLLLYFNENTF